MAATVPDRDQRKREAAQRALELVQPGMKLGLGSGSTAHHFVDLVGKSVADGLDIHCVATSEATEAQAKALGIRMYLRWTKFRNSISRLTAPTRSILNSG